MSRAYQPGMNDGLLPDLQNIKKEWQEEVLKNKEDSIYLSIDATAEFFLGRFQAHLESVAKKLEDEKVDPDIHEEQERFCYSLGSNYALEIASQIIRNSLKS